MKIKYSIFAFFIATGGLFSQDMLTLDDALASALKNNYDIQITRKSADIDRENNTPGNAGMLPTAAATGSGTYQYAMGDGESNSQGSVSGGVSLFWTVYDGGKMYVNRNKLAEIEALGEVNYRNQVMQTAYNVICAYYDIVRLNQNLATVHELIDYNNVLVEISDTGFKAGDRPKNDLLMAKIDLNTARQNEISTLYSIQLAKQNLNYYMGVNANYEYKVAENFDIGDGFSPNRDEYIQKINSGNLDLKALEMQINIAQYSYEITQNAALPTVEINGGYMLTKHFSGSDLGNDAFSHGPQIGASVSVPLFTAGENDRKANVAQLEKENAEIQRQKLLLSLNIELDNALSNYDNQVKLTQFESDNHAMALENIEINKERFRAGETTIIDVRQARNEFSSSETRLAEYQYNLKVAEAKLKLLAGEL